MLFKKKKKIDFKFQDASLFHKSKRKKDDNIVIKREKLRKDGTLVMLHVLCAFCWELFYWRGFCGFFKQKKKRKRLCVFEKGLGLGKRKRVSFYV